MAFNPSVFNVLNIITEIKTNPRQTPEELYSSFGISKSGFYKYKKLLQEIGFIFHYDRGNHSFFIEKEPFIPTLNLTLGELSALVRSTGQFYAAGGDFIITYRALKAVQKLVAHYPEKTIRRQLEEMFDETLYNRGYGCHEDILTIIERAWESRQILRIHYFSHSDGMQEVVHDVEPYMIFFKRRALYMDAYCRTLREIRMYRLNRVRRAEILPQTSFEIREEYAFKSRHQHAFSIFTGGTPTPVKIRFTRKKAAYIEEVLWHPSQKITPDPEHPGGIIFEVMVSYPQEVIWWVRQWGSDAEVIEPQAMREYMLEMARQEVTLYSQKTALRAAA